MQENNFSILLPVYWRDDPEALSKCFDSIVSQTLAPLDIVIVCDGPLTPDLDSIIDVYTKLLPLFILRLNENCGLGIALALGLENCRCELVARMDADDICHPSRFQKQFEYLNEFPEIDIIGALIAEFRIDPLDARDIRRLPTEHNRIAKYAQSRNPFNHMTVMFRKSKVLAVGGYHSFFGFEDYHLWVRMIMFGCKTANLNEVLVYARIGNGFVSRRGGLKYAAHEVQLYRFFYKIGFISFSRTSINIILRGFVRLSPKFIRSLIYRYLLRDIRIK
ncbi:glycosyltransferase [Polynucleobacter sphagniphilus]|jgi:glycosyltransferase involved in cell wall biosynthesis|uniref:Glycosyltransferase involved in cell wall biosynthesis n=1 Tax=Polynucleobacter sphagniphilus TaxID=1743169 RepID=A0AA43M9M3_9BURK|nr:glycosyltransferase [Polynucleobacter sphagniphilus]MDH6504711.1 glycosyltransferase involved in cell wall biosynthesis [Polynucleobacter sphagniphilus]MDH6513445.1 glycosyltransferase involved in cell wall biosynthesis [Polynucleobacter sphagniphilus]